MLNGKKLSELQAWWAADQEERRLRRAVQNTESYHRKRLREAAGSSAEAELGEQRRGSSKRKNYTPKEKVIAMEAYDKIVADQERTKSIDAVWKELPQRNTQGANSALVAMWCKPDTRRGIEKAASQAHASSLLRIDKEPRKRGRYEAMENELFILFTARRKRGCRVSPRWLTCTARILMLAMAPAMHTATEVAEFKGGRSWRARFCQRKGMTTRRKTNCKNTNFEDTKPVLQVYFRNLRRRVQGVLVA